MSVATATAAIEFRAAIRDAIDEELERDETVIFFGEDVAKPGGVFAVTAGLQERHGADRVFDTPISELAIAGAAFGAAVNGLRPVIEIMFGDFLPIAMDAIVNQVAKYWYLSQEQASVPLVIRSAVGAGGRFGAIHSQNPASWFMGVPGLKIVAPSTPGDAKALLKAAIRDENPVIFIEHEGLYGVRGEVGDGEGEELAFGQAAVRKEGSDVTIVGILKMAHIAEDAARTLSHEHGVEAEVIDPRTLRPLDLDTILDSVRKTNRAVIVEEGWPHGGVGANVSTLITEQAFDHLDAPVQRVTGADVHMPYSRRLEQAAIPHTEHVVQAALAALEGSI
jgi:pyruvate/2-oxoglutarate/acetoin dehydrogenase E1 component